MLDENTVVRIKVQVPGEAPQALLQTAEGFDLVPVESGTRYPSVDAAFDVVDDLAGDFPDATLNVIEEGWCGDWSGGVSPLHKNFWGV